MSITSVAIPTAESTSVDVGLQRARRTRAEAVRLRAGSGIARRRARVELEEVQEQLDLLQAWRSIPRGNDAEDRGRFPGVDVEVWLLHVRYARSRQPAVRAQLVEEYGGYATALARRLHREGEALEDLIQVALEALLIALERFDPARGIPFPAFANPTILGSLKRHYRDLGWSLRVPRRVHELAVPARDVADRLTMELGRSPTVAEVARDLGVEEETLLAAQEATHARSVSSLDAPMGDGERRSDLLGSVDSGLARAENRVALAQALDELTDRDREVLALYFFEDLSQSEIAERYDVSQMQVSRWLTASLRRLRSRMPADV
jgi:RNA polymerase sigma-B factor